MPEPETKDQAIPAPAPVVTDGRKLTLDEAEKIAERVLQRGLASRYVECPQCGVLVLRTDPVCHRDRIVYDNEGQKWYPLEEPAPAADPDTETDQGADDDQDQDGSEVIPGVI